jgi:hypothetical protein
MVQIALLIALLESILIKRRQRCFGLNPCSLNVANLKKKRALPWRGRKLPTYESRSHKNFRERTYSMQRKAGQGSNEALRSANQKSARPCGAAGSRCARNLDIPEPRLIDFQDASGFYNRRLFLASGKALSTLAIDINTGELLAVMVIDGHLPVMVFTPAVPAYPVRFPWVWLIFFHVWRILKDSDYRKFKKNAQVAS